jgi:hypothetical protein
MLIFVTVSRRARLSFFAPKIAAKIGPLILLIFAGVLIFGAFYVYVQCPPYSSKLIADLLLLLPRQLLLHSGDEGPIARGGRPDVLAARQALAVY